MKFKTKSLLAISLIITGLIGGCGNTPQQDGIQNTEEVQDAQEVQDTVAIEQDNQEENTEIIKAKEFSKEFISVMCGEEPHNPIIKDYFDNKYSELYPLDINTDSIEGVASNEATPYDDYVEPYTEPYTEIVTEQTKEEPEEQGEQEPKIELIDDKPYVDINTIQFDEQGMALVHYNNVSYVVTREATGYTRTYLSNNYKITDFRPYSIYETNEHSIDAYYKSKDDIITIGLNIQFNDNQEITGFKLII